MQPEVQHADGDGDDSTELLVRFIWHLGQVADARGASTRKGTFGELT